MATVWRATLACQQRSGPTLWHAHSVAGLCMAWCPDTGIFAPLGPMPQFNPASVVYTGLAKGPILHPKARRRGGVPGSGWGWTMRSPPQKKTFKYFMSLIFLIMLHCCMHLWFCFHMPFSRWEKHSTSWGICQRSRTYSLTELWGCSQYARVRKVRQIIRGMLFTNTHRKFPLTPSLSDQGANPRNIFVFLFLFHCSTSSCKTLLLGKLLKQYTRLLTSNIFCGRSWGEFICYTFPVRSDSM